MHPEPRPYRGARATDGRSGPSGAPARIAPMRRRPPAYDLMHRLALLAALLLLVAPPLSRWQQARAAMPQPLCSQHAAGRAPAGDAGMAAHAGHEGAACDYCLLAARLLPGPVLLLQVTPPRPATVCESRLPPAAPAMPPWPAHAPRGPPLAA